MQIQRTSWNLCKAKLSWIRVMKRYKFANFIQRKQVRAHALSRTHVTQCETRDDHFNELVGVGTTGVCVWLGYMIVKTSGCCAGDPRFNTPIGPVNLFFFFKYGLLGKTVAATTGRKIRQWSQRKLPFKGAFRVFPSLFCTALTSGVSIYDTAVLHWFWLNDGTKHWVRVWQGRYIQHNAYMFGTLVAYPGTVRIPSSRADRDSRC